MNRARIIFLVFWTCCLCGCNSHQYHSERNAPAALDNKTIKSADEAVSRAKEYAKRMHLLQKPYGVPVADFHDFTLSVQTDNMQIYNCPFNEAHALRGQVFWSVYFPPAKMQLGGGHTFLIKANTGDLLAHCAGR